MDTFRQGNSGQLRAMEGSGGQGNLGQFRGDGIALSRTTGFLAMIVERGEKHVRFKNLTFNSLILTLLI